MFQQTRHSFLTAAAFATLFLASSMPASSGQITIKEQADKSRLTVDVRDATGDEILLALSKRFEFSVERVTDGASGQRVTGRLQGTLNRILDRVLREDNYLIVRKSDSAIGRVLVLGTRTDQIILATIEEEPKTEATVPASNTPAAASGSFGIENTTNQETKIASSERLPYQIEYENKTYLQAQSLGVDGVDHVSTASQMTADKLATIGQGGIPSPSEIVALMQMASSKVNKLANKLKRLP